MEILHWPDEIKRRCAEPADAIPTPADSALEAA
jgi:hypothetical protein